MSSPSDAAPFVLVTGNAHKAIEAERILGWRPPIEDVDLPEIQSLDLDEVLADKVRAAWRHLGKPVVVEETGLALPCLGGFPGPLVKWMLKAAGADGLARCALSMGDPRATARCTLAFHDGDRLLTADGEAPGQLVLPPRGDHGFGWDPVLVPDGEDRTFAELDPADKDRLGHRGKAWRAFAQVLADAGIGHT